MTFQKGLRIFGTLMVLALLGYALTGCIGITPIAGIAAFSGNPTWGAKPLAVQFSDESTEKPVGWLWDFGDGTTSIAQNPIHTYRSPGVYTVSLTVNYGRFLESDTATEPDYIKVGDRAVGPGQTYTTIQHAINAADPGEIILVGPGTYRGDVTIDKDGITLMAASRPKIDGDLIVNANSVTVDTFEIKGRLETTPGSFKNLTLTDCLIWGVVVNIVIDEADAVVNPATAKHPETEKIQDAIDAASSTTIWVAPGTYHEQVIVDKALTLNGANAGIPGYGTRGPESIVDADDTDVVSDDPATWVAAFFIESGNVTIDGFKTIDADESIHVACDQPSWGDRENVVIKNNYVDTSEGYPQTSIAATGIIYYNDANRSHIDYSVGGAVVQDNYVYQVHGKDAIWFQDVHGSSITIKENKVDGNSVGASGIIMGATSALGFKIDLSGTVIEDNELVGNGYGIQLKQFTTSTSPVSITGNNITGGGRGLRLFSVGSETVIQGNTITNNDKGIQLGYWRTTDTPVNNVRILGNDILDNDIGILIKDGDLGTGNEAHFNNIVGNGTGVKNEDTALFDAENNWWGSAYGPEDSSGCAEECKAPSEGGWNCDTCDMNTAPAGQLGDKVSDNVDYCPWSLRPN